MRKQRKIKNLNITGGRTHTHEKRRFLTFLKNQRYKKGRNGATLGANWGDLGGELGRPWGRIWITFGGGKDHQGGRGYRNFLRWRNAFFTMAKRTLYRWRNVLYQDGESYFIKMANRTFPFSLYVYIDYIYYIYAQVTN